MSGLENFRNRLDNGDGKSTEKVRLFGKSGCGRRWLRGRLHCIVMGTTEKYNTSRLVAGYRQAFVDSSEEAEPEWTPRFVSNSGRNTVRAVIENELKGCSEMFMSVAFITSGGIAPFLGFLKELENRGVPGRILTTDYLMFSDPAALDKLNSLSNLDVRMYRTGASGVGFHTKGYMFHNNGDLRILIGSSNLTQAAISRNHEWNTMMVAREEGQFAKDVETEFEAIWNSSVSYSDCRDEYRRTFIEKEAERRQLRKLCVTLDMNVSNIVEPNGMQREFCCNVEKLVRDGEKRALLISATGTGKTFASAFALRNLFAKSLLSRKKVLFLSHREQINKQALKSYARVLGGGFRMELLSGSHFDVPALRNADLVFSTMQMMAKDELRQTLFSPEHFSVVILDECHRSGSAGYLRIMSYFRPEFMLGMSASPERNDGFDIYSQFDHNIACEIRLQTALDNDLLCPFHYFGITDLSIDGVHEDAERFRLLTSDERVRQIIRTADYYGFSGSRVKGLIFCSNKMEGAALSAKFNENGLRTAFLSGDDSQERRESAVARLVSADDNPERLDYILTVDIFNEGVDIPEINQVIMLRPTESAIVFVQQLGRRPALTDFDKYGELDPLRIIGLRKSYHNFLVSYDGLEESYTGAQLRFLEFISEKFASGKRPHELELLSLVLDGHDDAEDLLTPWRERMLNNHNILTDSIIERNVINIMSALFYAIGAAKKNYDGLSLAEMDGTGAWHVSKSFAEAVQNDDFCEDVREVIAFGLSRYKKYYSKREYGSSFAIGEKYTYEDVCRLLCWEKNEVSLNIGGYKYDERTRTYPVFINYSKDESISDTTKYEDRFVDRSNLIAISKSNRTLQSKDVDMAVHAAERDVLMELFVRKNKDDKESKEFYYLGRIEHHGVLHEFTMPNTDSSAVEIGYRLLTPVEPNLYEYLTASCE